MPTVILLDNSLSMCKNVKLAENDKNLTKRNISHLIIKKLIEHISVHFKHESLALVAYSSIAEVICEFTRDYSKILDSLASLKIGDYAHLEEGLNKVSSLVIDEWAGFTNIQIILITSEFDNLRSANSIRTLCSRLRDNKKLLSSIFLSTGIEFDERIHMNSILNEDLVSNKNTAYYSCQFPFSFPNRFDIICLNNDSSSPSNSTRFEFEADKFKYNSLAFSKSSNSNSSKVNHLTCLLELNNSIGKMHVSESLNCEYIEGQFVKSVFEEIYSQFVCELKCGHLDATVSLIPSPISYKGYQNYSYVNKSINKNLEICGFINISELTTPPTLSRHIIILDDNSNCDSEKMEVDSQQDGSFAILLHACLKSENMAAIVHLNEDWYGALHCWQDNKSSSDSKKKSNLMLSIFVPGYEVIQNIISKVVQAASKQADPNNVLGQAIKQTVNSYSKGCIIWYREYNLVTDIQKIIRTVKKINDKMPIFYKELNRVRKAALSIGFYDLLQGLANILERELMNYGSNYTQESAAQITNCINCLKQIEYRDYRKEIQPWIMQAPAYSKMPRK